MSTQDPPNDPRDADLFYLGRVKDMDWTAELAKCEHLLVLVAEPIQARRLLSAVRVPLLRAAMETVTLRAYQDYQESSNRETHIVASKVLAAAAVMGMVNQYPKDIKETLSVSGYGRNRLVTNRQRVAISWHYKDLDTVTNFVRRNPDRLTGTRRPSYEDECFTTFRESLIKVIHDDEAMNSLVVQLVAAGTIKVTTTTLPASSRISTTGPDVDYISRPTIESEIRQAFEKSSIVALIGEPGTGKSTLARAFIQGTTSRVLDAQLLGAPLGPGLIADVREMLGPNAERLTDTAAVIVELRRLLASTRPTIDYVVFDDVADWSLVEPLLPEHLAVRILVTARTPLVGRECVYVKIASLEQGEAKELIRRKLVDVTQDELAILMQLRGRALAIKHACAFMAQAKRASRRSFFNLIKSDVVQALDFAAGLLDEQALRTIYQDIVAALQEESKNEPAIRLLEVIAALSSARPGYAASTGLLSFTIPSYFRTSLYGDPDLGAVAFDTARSILEHHQLVEFEDYFDRHTRIEVHPLTLAMMQDIFAASLVNTARRFIEDMMDQLSQMEDERRQAIAQHASLLATGPPEMTYVLDLLIVLINFNQISGDPIFDQARQAVHTSILRLESKLQKQGQLPNPRLSDMLSDIGYRR